MTQRFVLVQGDTGRPLEMQFTYTDTALTLDIPAGTTTTFSMRPAGADTPTIDDAAAATISSAAGVVTVRFTAWQTAHVATPGDYLGEFSWPTLGISAPTKQPIPIHVRPRIGDTP